MKAVFLDRATLGEDISIAPLEKLPLQWEIYKNTPQELVTDRIKEASIVVTNKVYLQKKEIEKTHKLKYIAVAATGIDRVDVPSAKEKGITVSNLAAYSTKSVVQHLFTLLFALTSNLISYHTDITRGKWERSSFFSLLDHPVMEVEGKTLGIIGYGAIGQEVAKWAQTMGFNILVAKHPTKEIEGAVDKNELLRQSDFVTLHLPLNENTRYTISKKELNLMKPTAFLLNVSRGGLIREEDLLWALKEKKIQGAALDVMEKEPPDKGNPLLKQENLLITPHIAWASKEARKRLIDILADNINSYLEGNPKNLL